jgi:hypothetical protein
LPPASTTPSKSRTVGGHLHRLFPKLGVATSAALRDARAALPPEQKREALA